MKYTVSSRSNRKIDAPLEERKQRILRAVVRDYVETAEPVGSEALAERYDFGVKSATLRNEMAEMAEQGYLQQPHTSAGRIPSDKGYRYYVDWLITPRTPSVSRRQQMRTELDRARREVESILHQTCRMLSALTSYVSMATPPALEEDVVRQVHLAVIDRERLLVVLALGTGRVEHAVVSPGVDLMGVDLGRIEHQVGVTLRGQTVAQASDAVATRFRVPVGHAEGVSRHHACRQRYPGADRRRGFSEVVVEGTAAVLRQPEFEHTEVIRELVAFLEERRQLFSLLRDVHDEESRVIIGSEHPTGACRCARWFWRATPCSALRGHHRCSAQRAWTMTGQFPSCGLWPARLAKCSPSSASDLGERWQNSEEGRCVRPKATIGFRRS